MRTSRTVSSLVALSLGVLGLVGCSDDTPPAPTPSPSTSSASPTPSPTASPTTATPTAVADGVGNGSGRVLARRRHLGALPGPGW